MSDDQHGTRCGGEIAAIKNDACGVGVAHKAKLSGLRILSGPISDVDEAAALNYAYQDNHIYSCSWGPPDDGRSMDAPRGVIAKAMLNGVQNGRGGKGSIYVFAGGNGGGSDDQCNFDGYTNSILSMTIAAVDREGLHPYYSEMCSAIIATVWSSGSGDHIHTTDLTRNGKQRCTKNHGGTSAAAPLVAGVAALALNARPELTWRDMQHIAVRSALQINPEDKDWQKTQAGRHFNHKYGYGLIDAYQFVEMAKTHELVKPQAWLDSGVVHIPNSETLIVDGGVKSTFEVTKELMEQHNLESLEHVTVHVWITHERRGDVQVELTSPHGTKSVLARPRRYDEATTGFPGWGFMTMKHWDEDAVGTWTLGVFDAAHPKQTGNFYNWSMTLWGASIDADKAVPWRFPPNTKEATMSLPGYPDKPTSASTSTKHAKPTDHLPSDHGSAPGESHQDFTNAKPTDPATQKQATPAPAKPEADTGYLSAASLKKNSTWLFVAAGVVFVFAASVAAFFVLRRRRNRKGGAGGSAGGAERGAYEFVPDDEELAMGKLGASASGGGGGRRNKGKGKAAAGGAGRTKELYDAFGEEDLSDDSDPDDEQGDHALLASRAGAMRAYRDDVDDEEEEEEGDTRFAIGDAPGSAATPGASGSAAAGPAATASAPVPPVSAGDERRRAEETSLFDLGEEEEAEEEEEQRQRQKAAAATTGQSRSTDTKGGADTDEKDGRGSGSGESWQDAGKLLE